MLFKIIKSVFVVSLFFVFISCSSDETTIAKPLEATQFLDQSYGSDSKQNYDIYLPKGRTIETPVLVLVHGGFWSAGDKADMNLLVAIAKNTSPNYAIVNTNYRLASVNKNKHPTQLNDLSLLIEELKAKKDQYKIATNYYFVGVSAGAHLSLLYTYQKDINHNIKAVCSIVGPTDFLDPSYLNSPNTQL